MLANDSEKNTDKNTNNTTTLTSVVVSHTYAELSKNCSSLLKQLQIEKEKTFSNIIRISLDSHNVKKILTITSLSSIKTAKKRDLSYTVYAQSRFIRLSEKFLIIFIVKITENFSRAI